MIVFDDVTITWDGAAEPVLRNVNLGIRDGDLCVVVGSTGTGSRPCSGRSTAWSPTSPAARCVVA